jgi:hypothetical protein
LVDINLQKNRLNCASMKFNEVSGVIKKQECPLKFEWKKEDTPTNAHPDEGPLSPSQIYVVIVLIDPTDDDKKHFINKIIE